MRKIHILIIIVMIAMLMTNTAFAENQFLVKTNENALRARYVNILIDGNKPQMDAPAIILGDRTLVPVRFIAEQVGADVEWIAESRSVVVTYQDKVMIMGIDSDRVHVGNEIKKLDKNSTPRLVTFPKLTDYPNADSRTMVPARFISEILGFEVEWDPNTYTVSVNSNNDDNDEIENEKHDGISVSAIEFIQGQELGRLVISGTGKLHYTSMYIDTTKKVVIDIPDAMLDIGRDRDTPGNINIDNGVVEKVQYSQFTISPYTTRVVLTFNEGAGYDIYEDGDSIVVEVPNEKDETINDEGVAGQDLPSREPDVDAPDSNLVDDETVEVEEGEDGIEVDRDSSLITKVAIREDDNGDEYILLQGLSDPEYKVFELSNPKRYVIDIKNAVFGEPKSKQYPVSIGNASNMRVAQFSRKGVLGEEEDIVRIVFDIEDKRNPYPTLSVVGEGDDSVIREETDVWDNFVYRYDRDRFELDIKMDNLEEDKFDYKYHEDTKTLAVIIDNDSCNLPEGKLDIYDGYLKRLIVEKGRRDTVATIEFSRSITIDDDSDDDEIVFIIEPKDRVDIGAKTIVIDPGHGGKDPGARSSLGQLEKEHNLEVSLKIREALESAGYNVILTRDKDEWVELLDRPAMANNEGADLFISLHANANPKTTVRGLEVLYCPAYDCELKSVDQYPFAKAVYDNIIKLTGRDFGRGIVKGPSYIVVNRTSMPAIILETGYLTNPEENSLIWTREYQSHIVEGLVNGINEYFDNNEV